jgi:hypothetical protein
MSATAIVAQTAEVKDKPPMYTFVSNWSVPRAQWPDMEKATAATQQILEKGVASGGVVAFGSDTNLVHEADGSTHDRWWSSMSLAGLFNTLDQIYKSGSPTTPVLAGATKHWDDVFVSRYYNWKSGSWKDAYTHGSSYKLKADAPSDAVDQLSKNLFVPLFEKLLADGTVVEYEVDTAAVHTQDPGTFWIFYICPASEGLDKVNAAITAALKANPLGSPAFGSMVDFTQHRDELSRTNATYK